MDNNFHFQESCNSLIHFLEKEMTANNSIRMSVDVQLPYHLTGDEKGFIFSITRISKFLNQQLVEGMIDIEVLKTGQLNETIRIQVELRGTDQKYRSWKKDNRLESSTKLEWVKIMPYRTSFILHADYFVFSFQMTFHCEPMNAVEPALIFFEKRILLVEDNEISAFVFSSFLDEWGCEVTQVANGTDALIAFEKNIFDIVLIDSNMPDLNGSQVIKKIRGLDVAIPIIALTASMLERDIFKLISAGANDFLFKPISNHHLKKMLKKYL